MIPATCSTQVLGHPATRFRLIPAGRFRAIDGRPEGLAGWFMGCDAARNIIATLKAQQTEVVIDYEHQSLKGGKAPAAGWFKTLEWREGDGLYVTDAKWTKEAATMIRNQEYRYISPVFHYDKAGNVVAIVSAGITNKPALDGLTDLAAATRKTVVNPHHGVSQQDVANFKHVFGQDIFERMADTAEEEARLAIPPHGVTEKDHATMQHVFGKDYHTR